jgi:hypothetical protein
MGRVCENLISSNTEFWLTTSRVWAGNLVFSSVQTDQVLAAVRNFTENYPDDKAAIIATSEVTLSSLLNLWALFVFYNGEAPPPRTSNMFTSISPLLNTTTPTGYLDFISAKDGVVITGQVYQITTEMSPAPQFYYRARSHGILLWPFLEHREWECRHAWPRSYHGEFDCYSFCGARELFAVPPLTPLSLYLGAATLPPF